MGSGGTGKGSRRGGRRRSRGGRPPGGGGGGGGHAQAKKGAPAATHSPRKGKAFSTPYEVPEAGPIDPFDLFCACLLGLMPDGTYRGAGLGEVAKRFRRSPNEIRDFLQKYGMDPESLKSVDFDLTLAKLDIQVAPEGIDRRELARGLFEEFVDVHPTLGAEALGGAGGESGNGAAPAAHAHPHRRHPEPAPEGTEVAEEAVESEAEAAPEEGEETEPSLVTADVGRTAGGETEEPAGESAGHERRTVRQIRRSPVRRGR